MGRRAVSHASRKLSFDAHVESCHACRRERSLRTEFKKDFIAETMLSPDTIMAEARRFGLNESGLTGLCERDGTRITRITLRPAHQDTERVAAFLADLVRRDLAFSRA
jgi:hypothetical protein